MDNTVNRRHFLQLMAALPMASFTPFLSAQTGQKNKILLLLELKGGNDGLNTLIPFENPEYYRLRPKISIKANQVLKLGNGMGMNPAMKSLLPEWQANDMAWIQGIGYANPNRSHFRSIEIWETASAVEQYLDQGWISQLYQQQPLVNISKPLQGVIIGSDAGPMTGENFNALQMNDKKSFIALTRRLKQVQSQTQHSALSHVLQVQNNVYKNALNITNKLNNSQTLKVDFPNHQFGKQLETITQIILSGITAPVYKLEIGSFDTHKDQLNKHNRLLTQLSEGLAAFSKAMKNANLWDDVLVMTYSEFGRRANENASGGTDHGTAAAHFVLGGRVNGGVANGLIGQSPSLTDLDHNDLKYTTDFRSYYHTIARQWLGVNSLWQGQAELPIVNG